jgi:hypothetical protein
MKRVVQICLLILLLVSPAGAAMINGSFESGGFDGWDVTIPYGESEFDGWRPAGSASVSGSASYGHSATQGSFTACIGTGNEYFIDNQTWQITASQYVNLSAMETLSGDAFFYNGDYEPQDTGWVRIFDTLGNEVANPWIEYSGGANQGDPNSTDYNSATDWTHWEWQAATAGLYQLVLGVSTFGDNRFKSYAYFDNIQTQSVPEPSIIFLMGLAFFTGGGVVFKKRTKPQK